MSSSRIILIIITLLVIIGTGVFIARRADVGASRENGKIIVVATLFPLYDMARAIGGDVADVSLLLPPGTEPHSFEPTPEDILRISRADVFIYTGPAMEPWVADILKNIDNPNLIVVNASAHIPPLSAVDEHVETATGTDPHVWLDLENARIMARDIADALAQTSSVHGEEIRTNVTRYDERLATIDTEYTTGLASCPSRTFIFGGHYAFGYLATRYKLDYHAAQGFSPDSEPSASNLATLTTLIKKNRVTTIFYEELENPKTAETLARETGTTLVALSSAHMVGKNDIDKGVTFFDILKKNLVALRTGLSCN
ncbi:MAG: zinc ABC transporter solute-binding protein [Candidatus Yonathbacteria bacterium]|nr:zinc ABC transporter solute-binding protein [Candidatus Yonathbacteria bacterium]